MYFSPSGQIRGCREKGKAYLAFPSTYFKLYPSNSALSEDVFNKGWVSWLELPGAGNKENTVAKFGEK